MPVSNSRTPPHCEGHSCLLEEVGITSGWGETDVLMEVSSRRLAPVKHRHLPARGLLSLFSLLRAFLLTVIERNSYRGGTAEKGFVTEKFVYVQKRTERARFLFWSARTNMKGGGSGRGTNIYAHWRLRVRTPPCASVSFCWFLVLWGARRNARKQARCARLHWQKL